MKAVDNTADTFILYLGILLLMERVLPMRVNLCRNETILPSPVLILGRDMSLDGTAWDSPRTWTEGVMSLDIWDIYIIYIYIPFLAN